jgi:hypothetical protein
MNQIKNCHMAFVILKIENLNILFNINSNFSIYILHKNIIYIHTCQHTPLTTWKFSPRFEPWTSK